MRAALPPRYAERAGAQPARFSFPAMRLFVALDLEPALAGDLGAALAPYRARAPRARWVRVENFHLTLKFIGSWEPRREDDLVASLAAVEAEAFPLELVGLGVFPNPRQPRQLWSGVAEPGPVEAMAAAVERACAACGIAPEARPFTPHLTLARAAAPTALRPLVALLSREAPRWGREVVRAFHLYQSQTLPRGPVYSRRASFPLRPAAT